MILGLWDQQVKAIIEVKLGEADAGYYKYEPMAALLAWWEMIKKDKHGKQCHDQQKHFLPFVLSVDGILGRGALVVLSYLSRFMAEKMEEPLSQVRGWVNDQITIPAAMSYLQMIRRSRLPSTLREWDPDWDPESRIGLAG